MMLSAGACFFLTYWVGTQLQSELLPEVHQSEFTFEVALPVGTPLAETVNVLTAVEASILAQKERLKIETQINQLIAVDVGSKAAKAVGAALVNNAGADALLDAGWVF